MSDRNSLLTEAERTKDRHATAQFNWAADMSRPDISFSVCEASTKLKNVTTADVYMSTKSSEM